VVFGPYEIASCYDQLFAEGARIMKERALERVVGEMTVQERELLYARDVLRIIEADEAAPLLDSVADQKTTIQALNSEVDKKWLRMLVESEDDSAVRRVSEMVSGAFTTVRKARQKVRDVTVPQEPTDGRVREMLEMLPEQQSIDLKDLVLEMMSEVADPTQALDTSLESLADLFRRNHVQITVKRTRR